MTRKQLEKLYQSQEEVLQLQQMVTSFQKQVGEEELKQVIDVFQKQIDVEGARQEKILKASYLNVLEILPIICSLVCQISGIEYVLEHKILFTPSHEERYFAYLCVKGEEELAYCELGKLFMLESNDLQGGHFLMLFSSSQLPSRALWDNSSVSDFQICDSKISYVRCFLDEVVDYQLYHPNCSNLGLENLKNQFIFNYLQKSSKQVFDKSLQ